ncbi:polysaccharide pyruvyl transferase family protein [Arthrobacter sp. KBS0703]|uniref:polysaccharide pyruvyl transferase family protein n=1 Tax=Arthrobacter sp. KBS0703 TaxID=1955698 RepID=UPI00098FEDA5|nr:polysaccharide pyruvyl transferase family protein [Arthrobacter sp. KBS0703]TSE14816.1 polysaccharide pyruvyl transferase family protein [Arthrobacter sp. KBS0703]
MQPGPIYLIGPSGNPNFGDEFIAAAWLKYLAAERPDADVWLDCPQPGLAQILFEGLHPRLRVTNTLWRLVHDTADMPLDAAAETIRARVTGLGSPSYDLGLLKLREAESLHLIGGGFINENWSHHAGLVVAMRAVHGLTGARLIATGQGLMPLLTSAPAEMPLFQGFTHVTARDEAGATAYGITQGLDDAFLGAADEIARGAAEPGLYVCIQSDTADPERFEAAVNIARDAVEKAAGEGTKAYYVEAIPGADRAAYDRLADLIPEARFLPFLHIWEHGLPLSENQTWVTSRFHFHLLAAAAGARGVAVGMKKGYYDVKHESLTALGSGWPLALDSDYPGIPQQRGSLRDALPALVAQKRAEAGGIYPPLTGQTGSLTAGAAKLFNKAVAAPLRNKIRPGAR